MEAEPLQPFPGPELFIGRILNLCGYPLLPVYMATGPGAGSSELQSIVLI